MDVFPNVISKNYLQLRKEIKSGDILLCSGSSVFSNMIKQATNSVWSHVAFILRLDVIDRIMVLESVEGIGVRTIPLSSYARDYNGTGKAYPGKLLLARHQDMKQDNIIHLSKVAIDLLGYPYDTQEISRIATRVSLNALSIPTYGIDTPTGKEFICSEYAYTCFKSVGVTIDYNPLGFITPADFARCKKVNAMSYIATEDVSEAAVMSS